MPESLLPAPASKLLPLSDLSRFKAKAVIDWLDLEIHTVEATNFTSVQEAAKRILDHDRLLWVKALDEGPGRAATRFAIRLQDVAKRADLALFISKLRDRFDFASEPAVTKVEVAVDFFSRNSVRAELEAMMLRLKLHRPNGGANEIESGAWTDRVENVSQLRSDKTLVVKTGEVDWRYYLKDTDRGQPIADPADHRVRVEITLNGKNLPAGMDGAWSSVQTRFEALTSYFGFRAVIADEDTSSGIARSAAELVERYKIDRARRLGSSELAPARRERRKYSKHTRADSKLRERCRDALRDLSRRFNTENPVNRMATDIENTGKCDPLLSTT